MTIAYSNLIATQPLHACVTTHSLKANIPRKRAASSREIAGGDSAGHRQSLRICWAQAQTGSQDRFREVTRVATAINKLHLAKRMSRLGTEGAFDVLVRARELEARGKEIIHLEIGEPDFPTAPNIVEAAARALRGGWTHYGPPAGLPELREAVAADVSKRRAIRVDPSEVVITPGAKPIIFFSILALVEPGDEVLYPNPGFPIYESMIKFAGGTPVPYALREDRDFDVDVGEIATRFGVPARPTAFAASQGTRGAVKGPTALHSVATRRAPLRPRLIILNSPHNPTGGIMSRSEVATLAAALADRNVYVLADEIYSRLIYEGEPVSIMQFPGMKERTILLDGFSKTYAMTGWRLGYGVMRPELAQQVALLMTNSNSCTASFTQVAGVEALRGDQTSVARMLEEFRKRREVIVEGLNKIPGFRCRRPSGAFYAFPNITGTGHKSRELADALLRQAGVACLSGTAFGAWGEGYLRFSFANSVGNIQKALDRIEAWVRRNS
jgi:aspartate/methionine/tyrosine aminotransferase